MQFSDLKLEPQLISAIEQLNYKECTPIQAACIQYLLDGKDISGLAQTGTGKTAAFLVPLMDRILKGRLSLENLDEEAKAFITQRSFHEWRAQNFILILVPTRELAEQVYDNVLKLSIHSGLRGCAIYGGTAYEKQIEAVKNGVDFIVATPGRLIDLFKENYIDLKQVRAVVFDEADRMFDMGFKDDMKFILSRIPRERQFLVFSATLNFDVLNTAYQFGAEPIEVNVSKDQAKAENVKDEIFHVSNEDKGMYLLALIKKYNPKQTIIFSNFKFSVERIARFLSDNGCPAMGISSLLSQSQRNRVMEQFKAENEKNILVATDVAARGLDIKGVDMVINYEMPNDAESYVHRIGRTGRAGAEGRAYSLVSDKDVDSLNRVEEYLKNKLPIGWLEDSDLLKDLKPMRRDDSFERNDSHGFKPRENRAEGGRRREFPDRKDGRHDKNNRNERGDRGDRPGRRAVPHQAVNSDRPQHERGDHRKDFKGHEAGGKFRKDSFPKKDIKSSSHSKRPLQGNKKFDPNFKPKFEAKNHKRKPYTHTNFKKPAKAKSIVEKVSGFFKKIFGD